MSSSSQGDEARRALIEDLELAVGGWPANQIVSVGFTAKNWRIVLAALRADPVRAAEEMAERTAKLVETYPDSILSFYPRPNGPPGNCYVQTTRAHLAAAIRALPTQPAAEGGAE